MWPQGEELEPARAKAEAAGVKEIFIDDVREEFVREYVFPMFRCAVQLASALAASCEHSSLAKCGGELLREYVFSWSGAWHRSVTLNVSTKQRCGLLCLCVALVKDNFHWLCPARKNSSSIK